MKLNGEFWEEIKIYEEKTHCIVFTCDRSTSTQQEVDITEGNEQVISSHDVFLCLSTGTKTPSSL